jgi:hypothetical protein
MTGGNLRLRLARWLDPTTGRSPVTAGPVPRHAAHPAVQQAPQQAAQHAGQHAGIGSARPSSAWPVICDLFALHLLGLAEELRPALDSLEGDEDDPDRLKALYQVDHAVTRMRRAVRDMRILAGREDEEMSGCTSSLVDVLRVAESSIERYEQISIGKIVELAVVSYAAEDLASLLAALLDNATTYSPGSVTVSAHLLENGSVMLRAEDSGIGIAPDHLEVLNTALAGPVPDVDERTGKHTGFPVVHRLARKHGFGVRLASRTAPGPGGGGGTIAMVTVPPHVLCEIPDPAPGIGRGPEPALAVGAAGAAGPAAADDLAVRTESARLRVAGGHRPVDPARREAQREEARQVMASGGLPRRERTSLRGDHAGAVASARTTRRDQAAAGRSFADDLTAFTSADEGARSQSPSGAKADVESSEEQVRE